MPSPQVFLGETPRWGSESNHGGCHTFIREKMITDLQRVIRLIFKVFCDIIHNDSVLTTR